ncbi:hypothetical protein QSK_1002 [Clostridioides difficile P29]|nr:hypothetical protein QSK_1002 [Clostridioides difficile P29]
MVVNKIDRTKNDMVMDMPLSMWVLRHIHAVPLLPRRQAVFRFRGLSHSLLLPAQRTVSNDGLDCSLSLWLVQA